MDASLKTILMQGKIVHSHNFIYDIYYIELLW